MGNNDEESETKFALPRPFSLLSSLIPVLAATLLLALPILSLVYIAASGDFESLNHIMKNVVPRAAQTTLFLLLGVGIFVAVTGTLTAWLVAFYDFPFRNQLQWALMLPFAVPTYISAYAFVEFFSFTGPLQSIVRDIGGYTTSKEYWFPEIRSLWGASLIMGLVLYPYVYLAVRTLFRFQAAHLVDSARILGARSSRLLFAITLPMARPAIILGVTLALMETLNDIGAVEHLGVHTLTFSIFSVWLNQSDLPGAAQISLLLLIIVLALISIERLSRGARKFYAGRISNKVAPPDRQRLSGWQAICALIACLTPVILGFGIPVFVLASYAIDRVFEVNLVVLLSSLATSVVLGIFAAFVTVVIGLFLSFAARSNSGILTAIFVRIACSGYAIPGTLIALGLFLPIASFDNHVDAFMRSTLGISTGLLVTGSGAIMIFAYVIRFMTMAEGNLTNGFGRLSPNLDMAGRNLGRNRKQVIHSILLPLLWPAIISASLLVFVEVVKELSATIMLRPFGMNTLATHVYDYASQARIEDAAIGCLLIILVGMLPVVFLLAKDETKL
ncbi:MAG: ABC transporter permease [Rhizobiaceae bacterium]